MGYDGKVGIDSLCDVFGQFDVQLVVFVVFHKIITVIVGVYFLKNVLLLQM